MQDNFELRSMANKHEEELLQRFHEELKKQPEISDEQFMAEFEASDEEYRIGFAWTGLYQTEKEKK